MLNEPRGGHDDDDEPQFLDDNNLNGLKTNNRGGATKTQKDHNGFHWFWFIKKFN